VKLAQHFGALALSPSRGKFSEHFMSEGLFRPASTPATGESFEDVVLPHLDAGYRLARWLMRNEHDAEDVLQEASLRAFRYFRTFTGGNGRAWFLRIVRNTCGSWRRRGAQASCVFDENFHSSDARTTDPESLLLQVDSVAAVEQALRSLPDRFRELLVLRELEDLSYRELADVIGIPMGTVMSGLSRARQAFRRALNDQLKPSAIAETTHLREQRPEAVLASTASWNRRTVREVMVDA
jgi:RNA polymerase sigma-70 factor, ECF subfamily